MDFWREVLRVIDWRMETPQPYGWFHLMSFALSILAAVALCVLYRKGKLRNIRLVVLVTAITVTVLEVYKQINFSFSYENGIEFDYSWWSIPWQFCSMPMYVGLVAGLTKGRVHRSCCAFLATYAMFAGACVMFYPTTVFVETIGINIQTMVCHGSMLTIGVLLMYTEYVKLEHRTILRAMPVFAVGVGIAMIINELAYVTGLLETDTINAFYISPYCEPHLPVYSLVQPLVPFPVGVALYIGGFTLASYLILLVCMGIKQLAQKKMTKMAV